MERECNRCGAWLGSDEGICPTCGEVYGNQTLFQMPQITREMIDEDTRRRERTTAPAAPPPAAGAAPTPQAVAGGSPGPSPASAPPGNPAAMRARPPQANPTTTAMPMLPGRAPAGARGPSFLVLMLVVLAGALLIGLALGLLIL